MADESGGILLSVIIPTYRARALIDRCLASHAAQDVTAGVEWIVVDSGDDGTAEWIAAHHPRVRLIRSAQRMLASQARNRGVASARGRWLAFTDHDVEVPPDWTARILRRIEGGAEVFGGPVLNGTPESTVGTADYFCCFSEYLPCGRDRTGNQLLVSANLIMSRAAWDAVGGQDERLALGEDTVQVRTWLEAGRSTCFAPELAVRHLNRDEPARFLANQRRYAAGAVAARRRYRLTGDWLLRMPLLALVLPFYRTALVLRRILTRDPRLLPAFVRAFPWFLRGQFAYAAAFRAHSLGD